MSDVAITVENLSKLYRLNQVGTGTISHDLNRWWHVIRGKEDPYLKIGEVNDRSSTGKSDYAWALRDINFEVKKGEVLGIIGKNGAGKSTLLKILSKVTGPTTGSIKAKGRIASLLEVGTGFHPELTGRENIYLNGTILGMTKAEVKSKLDEIVEFAGVARYLDTPVKRYSSGMMVRLGFAVAAHLEPEILIVDEVLAVGDAEFQKKAVGKMQEVSSQGGRTVLFVSHNMNSIRNLCKNCILLSKGEIIFSGSPSVTISKYLSNEDHKSLTEITWTPPNNMGFKRIKLKKNKFEFKEKIEVFLEVHLGNKIFYSGLKIAFYVRNQEGTIVFFSESGDHNFNFGKCEQQINLNLTIPGSFLLQGRYTITISLGSKDEIIDNKANCIEFEIEDLSNFRTVRPGVIKLPIQWEATQ